MILHTFHNNNYYNNYNYNNNFVLDNFFREFAKKYELNLPQYPGIEQIVDITDLSKGKL